MSAEFTLEQTLATVSIYGIPGQRFFEHTHDDEGNCHENKDVIDERTGYVVLHVKGEDVSLSPDEARAVAGAILDKIVVAEQVTDFTTETEPF